MRAARRLPPLAMLAVLSGVVLSGCSFVPAPERPEVAVPPAWTAAAPVRDATAVEAAAVPADAVWWTRFGSAELDRLMARALDANLDLVASLRRIDQARAQARIAGAGQLPTVGGSGSLAYRRQGDDRVVSAADTTWQGGVSASWEADLWGARAAATDAATARLAASRLDREALRLVVQSDVASTYFLVLALAERIDIAERNLEAARRVLQLVETRFEQGASSALEVAQQRTAVASFQAQLPQLEQQRRTAANALAVLLGRPPQGFGIDGGGLSGLVLPDIAPGQPADLLERRPDIRRVEANLRAADADIGTARAAFYPTATISLSGTLAGAFSGGATTTAASLASALAAPIFSGGRLEGGVDLSYARRAELVETYGQTVLVAFREVEDALVAVEATRARTALQEVVAREARIAYDIAEARYDAGAADFLAVLDAQRTLLSAEDGLVQARLARFTAAIDLFAALGGGWAGG